MVNAEFLEHVPTHQGLPPAASDSTRSRRGALFNASSACLGAVGGLPIGGG
jgi:hypothetical protein